MIVSLADNSQQTLDGNSSEHSWQTNSSSLTWMVRCCLKLAKREKLLSHSGHVRLFSSCIAMCRRRFSGIVYVCEHWGQRYGLSSSWVFKWALYLLSLSNSISHRSHVWTPYKTITENSSHYRWITAKIQIIYSKEDTSWSVIHSVNVQRVVVWNSVHRVSKKTAKLFFFVTTSSNFHQFSWFLAERWQRGWNYAILIFHLT